MRLSRFAARLKTFDWVLPTVTLILVAIGLTTIYSVDLSRGETLIYFPRQVFALILGLTVLFITANIHIAVYQSTAKWIYLFAAIMLVAVLLFGETIRGTRGWFQLMGFSFQPAELAKVALVFMLPWLVHRHGRRFHTWQFVASTALTTFLLAGLIMMQPDLGSALILVGLWFLLILFVGVRKRYIFGILGIGLVAVLVGWTLLFKPYQKERILTFLDPTRDPLGSGYNVTQSIIAVGSGKLMGRGLGFGSQSQLHFLPEAQTDFIFSVIAEELGFIAVLTVLSLFFLLFWRLIYIARHCKDDFRSYVVLSIALVILVQMMINIGATLGLLPVTGVTLPFLSYGGSSLLINMLLIGIAESVARTTWQRGIS